MARKKRPPRSVVVLTALDAKQKVIDEIRLSTEQYYEESAPIIDSGEYRRERGIRVVRGEIFNSSGQLTQSFANKYAKNGALVHSRAVHDDGTVTEGAFEGGET